jgi:Family of unknown function (DUF6152)
MTRPKISLTASAVLLLVAIASVWAHHSPSAIFDMGKRISITGTLTKIDWINPHIVIAIDAKADGGKVDHWTFESNPPSWYRSVGLARADFAKAMGQTVTVEGVRAKDGSFFGYMQKIKLPDGTSLELVNGADLK